MRRLLILLVTGIPLVANAGPAPDGDSDGIPDALDKCLIDSRNVAASCDTDVDGYGNVCDADFNQDFSVAALDFGMLFVPAFKGLDPAPYPQGMDMNCDN